MLPNRIALSSKATDKLRYIKQNTGVTPNILSRIALMLAIRDSANLLNAGVNDSDGQILSRDVLFGDSLAAYEVLINQFIHDSGTNLPIQDVICALIEIGVFKMGHVRKLQDLVL